MGGWAVDFLHGVVSRPHRDVDLLIGGSDALTAVEALSEAGFQHLEPAFPDEGLEFERGGVAVQLVFVVRDASGQLVTPGRWLTWPWPPDTLSGPTGQIDRVFCRVISVAAQIDSKRNYERNQGDPPRAHDLHDLHLLEAFLAHD